MTPAEDILAKQRLQLRIFGVLTPGAQRQQQCRCNNQKSLHNYSLLKMNTQLMAATIPAICQTEGKAGSPAIASSTIESRQHITGEQASASGAMTIALP